MMDWRVEYHVTKEALKLMDDVFMLEGLVDIPRTRLPVVDDSGSAMKVKPVKQIMLYLGLIQTFAHPRTRNEIPILNLRSQ